MTSENTLKKRYPDKVVDAKGAMAAVKQGSRVFMGTGCGEPQHLIRALVNEKSLFDIMIYQMFPFTLGEFVNDESFCRRFSMKLFFITTNMQQAVFEGKIDYIPAYLSQIPRLFSNNVISLDTALIQVSPPDRFGFCSLGISVDITRAGMENARCVIAQVNPNMPRTWGDSFVHVDDIDLLVFQEEPLVESLPQRKDRDVVRRIGYYVSQLIDDGATIQMGFGRMPYSILKHFAGKKDLGLHTQLITDEVIPLMEKKVITNKRKNFLPGRILTSLCLGTKKIYDYVNDNPEFYFRASEFVNDPNQIARNDNMVSITSAFEVDLTGQVCSDSLGSCFYSGICDQVDFLRGSSMSKGGVSIIALPSTANQGRVSRIVSALSEGAGVAATRGDANFVVTEYGIAEMQGKGIYQRVMELVQITHPKFREELLDAAKGKRYIFSDQLPPSNDDLLFLESYKGSLTLKNGMIVEFRPVFPSDEFEYRNFFYSLTESTIYSRFFQRLMNFSHEMVQKEYKDLDYRSKIMLIGLVQRGGRKEIVAMASYAGVDQETAEVAFVTKEEFQGQGMGSYLLGVLEPIAKENGYKRFCASALRENASMIKVFKKKYPEAEVVSMDASEVEIIMEF